jgi:hypothetical protein
MPVILDHACKAFAAQRICSAVLSMKVAPAQPLPGIDPACSSEPKPFRWFAGQVAVIKLAAASNRATSRHLSGLERLPHLCFFSLQMTCVHDLMKEPWAGTASATIVGASLWFKNKEVGAKNQSTPTKKLVQEVRFSLGMTIVHDLMKEPPEKASTTNVGASLWQRTKKLELKTNPRPALTPSTNQMTSTGLFLVAGNNCPQFDARASGTASTTIVRDSLWFEVGAKITQQPSLMPSTNQMTCPGGFFTLKMTIVHDLMKQPLAGTASTTIVGA